jgi:hypothetical protein
MWFWKKPSKFSDNISLMVVGLCTEIEKDARRMARWRRFHLWAGWIITIILTVIPAALATGVIPYRESFYTKICLFFIAVASSLNVAYKPYQQSLCRRQNKADSLALLYRYKLAIVNAADDEAKLKEDYKNYSQEFVDLYSKRANNLVENEVRQFWAHKAHAYPSSSGSPSIPHDR